MNVYLGERYEEFVRNQVASGRYTSASEVMRDALRDLEDKIRLESLRQHIAEAQAEYDRGDGRPMNDEFWSELEREIATELGVNE
jgi:antitoxin ParD1/3/4